MTKRGQVTLFVVIALVVLIAVALYLYAREEYGLTVPTPQYLQSQLIPIQDNIERCVEKEFTPAATLLGQQGGSYIPSDSVLYKGKNVKVVCANIPGKTQCLNILQSFTRIESELAVYLNYKMDQCINKDLAKNKPGYTVEGTKGVTITVDARGDGIQLTVDYDIKLAKEGQSVTLPAITKVLRDAPLHELYGVAVDIVNSEATTGDFDNLGYMLQKRGQYLIQTDKPFPNTIYKITKKNSNYPYWIAITGAA